MTKSNFKFFGFLLKFFTFVTSGNWKIRLKEKPLDSH